MKNLLIAVIYVLILSSYSVYSQDTTQVKLDNINNSIIIIKSGLSIFFNYLTSTEKNLDKIDLNSNDYLGDMAKELNQNIQKIKDGLAIDNEVINEAKFVSKMIGKGFLVYRINGEANNVYINELLCHIHRRNNFCFFQAQYVFDYENLRMHFLLSKIRDYAQN